MKELLLAAAPLCLYVGIFVVALLAIVRRVQWAFYLLIVLVALPTLWYKVHDFPLGHSTFDILFAACCVGIITRNGGFDRTPNGRVIIVSIVVSYIALWNTSLRFNMPLPLTVDNDLLPLYKNYAEMLVLYFVAYNALKTDEQQRVAVVITAVVLLFICVHEIRNFDAGSNYLEDRRSVGPFWIVGLGANHFGAFIAYVGAVFVGLCFVDKEGLRRWLYLTIMPCLVYPLFNAYSRGAYAGAVAALIVVGVLRARLIVVGLIVLGFMWQLVLPTAVVERVLMTGTSTSNLEDSAAMRLQLWEKAKEIFGDHPIFGIGFDGFGVMVNIQGLRNVHNYYMQVACEQGVIGLGILFTVFLVAFVSGFRLYRNGTTSFRRGLGLGFAACVVAEMITNIFGDRWSYLNLGAYFWIYWGIVDRARRLSEADVASKPALAPSAAEQPALAGTAR